MAKSKSQWDFGELFPPEPKVPERKVLSVAELTTQIRRALEKQIGSVWVGGEVTNLRFQSSGHIYFTLKDASSQVSCVLFRGETVAHRDLLEDGQKLLLQGDVTVYEARGQYQLIVRAVELQGIGALQIAFEKLKQKLAAEGLFAPERKRPLPRFPQRIGLVTSPTGAAIRDVLHVIRRRNPGLEIILAPCRVQGEGAAREIAEAVRNLNNFARLIPGLENEKRGKGEEGTESPLPTFPFSPLPLDLILLTRGGGSLEDLWAFNEEIVARAIFESRIPVVSAVGHEIDFTISDFVADFRAATPSAAAEIITEGVFSSCEFVSDAARRMRQLASQQLEDKAYELAQLRQRLGRVHPRRKFNEWRQHLDDLQTSLQRCARAETRRQRTELRNLSERLLRVRPAQLLKQRREVFEQELQRLREQMRHRLGERKSRFETLQTRLRLLGPEQVLARGYSITTDAESGKVLRDAKEVKPGQKLKTRLKTGEIVSRAIEEN
ncbi:MAG TPA: exodeoxyribonuclease VII large subunit [Verrucomicrobiae bacterium]|jgi:exodeoxyribonuclease VII large subunit|nr:exodeoxyribonuclease VII large subunit [Verrucomicrobiae bacterium]